MSNARKLQTEIDRVLKKVDEGVELFDEIWEKVYSAEQQNQKEKYEMDLKKEIKKLQRLRDQIKSWISSAEVKDKDALFEARKLIETKMEAFKTCEKETKTKTYSKEGLARAEQLSPEEEAKRNTSSWISDSIERLQAMVQDQEVEIEKLQNGKGKKTNKNLIDECNHYIAMHRFHLHMLEGIMRLVNNDMLETDDVDPFREDLDYYMDSYKEDEYQQAYDEDFFYESLGLDDLPVVNVVGPGMTNPVGGSVGGSTGGGSSLQNDRPGKHSKGNNRDNEDVASSSSKGSKDRKGGGGKRAGSATLIPLTIGRARKGGAITATTSLGKGSGRDGSDDENSTGRQTPSKMGTGRPMASVSTPGVPTPTTIPAAGGPPAGASMAAILKRETEQQEMERQQKADQLRQQQLQAQQAAALRQQQEAQARQQQQQQQEAALRQRQLQEAAAKQKALQEQQAQQQAAALRQQQEAALRQQQQQQAALQQQQLQQQQQQQQQLQAVQEAAKKGLGPGTLAPGTPGTIPGGNAIGGGSGLDIISGLNGLNLGGGPSGVLGSLGGKPLGNDVGTIAGIPTANGSVGYNLSAAIAAANNSSMLQESFATLPTANEQERPRPYTPQNPYSATPQSFPSTPSTLFDNPAIFEKLGTDALFFIFYYQQGTYQQYLAARELKKQSWRFHKKYMTWFQRHEEPKLTTDEYEQGTYVYFDYETGWCTRIKQDFRFEYSFLEDSLQ